MTEECWYVDMWDLSTRRRVRHSLLPFSKANTYFNTLCEMYPQNAIRMYRFNKTYKSKNM